MVVLPMATTMELLLLTFSNPPLFIIYKSSVQPDSQSTHKESLQAGLGKGMTVKLRTPLHKHQSQILITLASMPYKAKELVTQKQ